MSDDLGFSNEVNLSFVTDRIAVGGGVYTTGHVEQLKKLGITHVFDCRQSRDWSAAYVGSDITRVRRGVDDDGEGKPNDWYHEGILFAFGALQVRGTKLYIHCTAGVNRSPGMTYAVLRALGLQATEVRRLILAGRAGATQRYFADAERAVKELGYV